MTEEQHNLEGITIPPGHDIRLETINNLTAIIEHDPFLDCFQRARMEETIKDLENAIRQELGLKIREDARKREAGMYQTALLDPVRPVLSEH